jgi:hypothetical protein
VSGGNDPVSRLWRSVVAPDSDELRNLARRAASEPQHVATRKRRFRARWAVIAVGAAALLVGSGLGFGLGTSVTPSGSAGRNVVGFGFLPGRGWDVVQTGGSNPGTTKALASKDGIVISVTSRPRGDPAEDIGYELRELPLQVADARRSSTDPSGLVLRAGAGGYNIDAQISFSGPPTAATREVAQRQLNRLVVAAARVTMAVRPAVSSPLTAQVTAFGTIDRAKEGESVTIQAKDCGTTFFRVFAGANTEADGTWSTFIFPRVTTTLRALWNGETSPEVVFRHRAFVRLEHEGKSRFRVAVGAANARFHGRPVTIQQFDQRIGRWTSVKRVRLSDDYYTYFTLSVPKGTRLRAFFPNALAKPCYLGATSSVLRT